MHTRVPGQLCKVTVGFYSALPGVRHSIGALLQTMKQIKRLTQVEQQHDQTGPIRPPASVQMNWWMSTQKKKHSHLN
jgi:hypothetical protein